MFQRWMLDWFSCVASTHATPVGSASVAAMRLAVYSVVSTWWSPDSDRNSMNDPSSTEVRPRGSVGVVSPCVSRYTTVFASVSRLPGESTRTSTRRPDARISANSLFPAGSAMDISTSKRASSRIPSFAPDSVRLPVRRERYGLSRTSRARRTGVVFGASPGSADWTQSATVFRNATNGVSHSWMYTSPSVPAALAHTRLGVVQLARGMGVVEERLNCIMRYRWAHPYPLVVKAYTYRVLLTRRYGVSFGVGVHAADEVHRCVPFAT